MYCLCVNVYCYRVTTQLQLINISKFGTQITSLSVSRRSSETLLLCTAVSRRRVTFLFFIFFLLYPHCEGLLRTHVLEREVQMSHATTQIMGGRPTEMAQHV